MASWVDFLIVAILVLSALISLVRGLVREALSLAGWVAAFWVGIEYGPWAAARLDPWVGGPPGLRLAIGFAALVLATLLAAGVVSFLAGQLVARTGLGGTDRTLGLVFGLTRGAVVVTLLTLLAGLTALPQDRWWQESLLVGHFQEMALWARAFLPADIAAEVRF